MPKDLRYVYFMHIPKVSERARRTRGAGDERRSSLPEHVNARALPRPSTQAGGSSIRAWLEDHKYWVTCPRLSGMPFCYRFVRAPVAAKYVHVPPASPSPVSLPPSRNYYDPFPGYKERCKKQAAALDAYAHEDWFGSSKCNYVAGHYDYKCVRVLGGRGELAGYSDGLGMSASDTWHITRAQKPGSSNCCR